MKHILLCILSSLLVSLSGQETVMAAKSNAEVGTITVHLTGLKSNEGQLMVALYRKDTWLKEPFMGELVEIEAKQATVVFKNVPYGTYGVSAVHDEDNNNELNTGLFGIPTEPYASSRGATNRFGPPRWKDAKFEVKSSESSQPILFR